jgi:hypothetical protein
MSQQVTRAAMMYNGVAKKKKSKVENFFESSN